MIRILYLPDSIAFGIVAVLQSATAAVLMWRGRGVARGLVAAGWAVSMVVITGGFLLRFYRVYHLFPPWGHEWGRSLAWAWALFSVLMMAAYAFAQVVPLPRPEHNPARRGFLRAARICLLGAPAAVMGYGTFIERSRLTLREQNIVIPDLPKDLDGLRIAQLTDIHLSPFLSVRELNRAVAMANETHPHLALITGDLITTGGDPLDDCLEALSHVRAEGGVFGCMGNHEIYAGTEEYTERGGARLGMRFLRQRSLLLRFGGADLNLAGVDYQRSSSEYLRGAERLAIPGAFNVLLSHNPDVFPVAVRKGFPLTISGHTHGGQVTVEILGQHLSVARFFTPYVDGLYRHGRAAIFVSRGIGTIGLPTRLGAVPEVALLKLCRT